MKKILIVSIILSLASNILFATTYYVSNGGDDTNSGLSPADPWSSINKINSSTFLPGDSILFNRSDTWNERLQVPTAGAIGLNILFGAYGTGSKPIIDVLSSDVSAITCYRSFITFQDLILKNSTSTTLAISVVGGCYGINVFRVEVFNSGHNAVAISKGGSDILIDSVRVINASNNGIILKGSEFNKLSNVIVENCYVSGVAKNDGIVIHEDGDNYTAGSNFIIRNNYAEFCAEQGFDITTGSNVFLMNNISENNGLGGVVVGHSADSVTIHSHTSLNEPTLQASAAINIGGDATNVKLIYSQVIGDGYHLLRITGDNVEIYNNVFAWDGGGTSFDLSGEIENIVVKNNVFTTLQGSMNRVIRFLTPTRPPDHPTFEFDNNIYYSPDSVITIYSKHDSSNYSLSNYQTTFGQDSASFFAKPEFVNRVGSDFHLTFISPAIDMGVNVGLDSDFDNSFVPYNLIPDIGAFEYSPTPITTIFPTDSSCQGLISLPITVWDIEYINDIHLVLEYDTTKCDYLDYQNINPIVNNDSLDIILDSNKIIISWNSNTPITLVNDTLLELVFNITPQLIQLNSDFIWNTSNSYYLNSNEDTIPSDFQNGELLIYPSVGNISAIQGNTTIYLDSNLSTEYYVNSVINADTYEWYLLPQEAGNIYGGDTTAIVEWNVNSNVLAAYIYVTASNQCGEMTSDSLCINISPVGIKEKNSFPDIFISPNPSNGFFNISINGIDDEIKLSVVNTQGNVIQRQIVNSPNNRNTYKLDISNEPSGVYYLTFSNQNYSITKKVIVNTHP